MLEIVGKQPMRNSCDSEELARQIRALTLRMVHSARASHVGGALSMVDILAVLYSGAISFSAADLRMPSRDRVILSKGHACSSLYAVLALRGFFDPDELGKYGQDGSVFMTHASHHIPGVEFSTGSLGHGLPFGAGKALAAKRRGEAWRSFVILSDGELDEGSNWEAILFSGHHGLDNLVAIVDCNGIQSLGGVSEVLELEPLADKFRAFRWAVIEADGHDHGALRAALDHVPSQTGMPTVILARTVKGKGVDFMENRLLWHYRNPADDQLAEALRQVGA